MKKIMKLAWMVLFALPMISLTACGDDDEPEPASVKIQDTAVTYDVDNHAATITFDVKANNLPEGTNVKVTYNLSGIPQDVTVGSDGVYTITRTNVELGSTQDVTITATAADAQDKVVVTIAMPLFKDYSFLLNMTASEANKAMGMQSTVDGGVQQFFPENVNVEFLFAYYTLLGDSYNEIKMVDSYLNEDLNENTVYSYLKNIYGDGEWVVDEEDGDEFSSWDFYTDNLMISFYPIDMDVVYIGYSKSRSNVADIKAAVKANRAKAGRK